MRFEPRTLGRSGLRVGALGLAASYGAPAESVEYAFERGVRYFYWGSMRRDAFGTGLRRLASRRDEYSLVIQSYSRLGMLIPLSLERALKKLKTEYTDVLLLGLWGHEVPPRILASCRALVDRGLVRHVAISTHKRPLAAKLAGNAAYDILHVRYNAKHTGAEREILPLVGGPNRPGIVSFTATSWGQLLDPKRVPPGERTPTAADCYRFVLTNPAVDLCLTGPSNMEQTRQALSALELGPMTEEEMAWMRRVGAAIYKG